MALGQLDFRQVEPKPVRVGLDARLFSLTPSLVEPDERHFQPNPALVRFDLQQVRPKLQRVGLAVRRVQSNRMQGS